MLRNNQEAVARVLTLFQPNIPQRGGCPPRTDAKGFWRVYIIADGQLLPPGSKINHLFTINPDFNLFSINLKVDGIPGIVIPQKKSLPVIFFSNLHRAMQYEICNFPTIQCFSVKQLNPSGISMPGLMVSVVFTFGTACTCRYSYQERCREEWDCCNIKRMIVWHGQGFLLVSTKQELVS